jgi:membrane protein
MTKPAEKPSKPGVSLSLKAAPVLALAAAVAAWAPWRRVRGRPAEPAACLTPEEFDAAEPGRGRAATAPWRIPARGWKDIIWRTYEEVSRARLPALAASVTFFMVFATFPAVAAFVSLYGIFTDGVDVERHFTHIADFIPTDAVHVIAAEMMRITQTRNSTLGATFAVSTLLSVWSANAGMKALFDGVNIAYDETEKRSWIQRTVFTYFATLTGLLLLTALTAFAISAPMFAHGLGVHHARRWLTPVRWLLVYLAAACVFSLVYRFGPSRTLARWRWVAPGGALAAALWMGGSVVYTWGLDRFTHFGVTYGSLGAVLGLMLWLWFSAMTMLLGAELNAEIEHQTAQDTTVGLYKPLGMRGAVVADSVGKAFTLSFADAGEAVANWLREISATVRRVARI